ncbi:MAG: hypothetical protein Q8P31_07965 [Bacillota bacterium]|nr:hypothetical protein [Bacillota bacterium]
MTGIPQPRCVIPGVPRLAFGPESDVFSSALNLMSHDHPDAIAVSNEG